MDVTAELATPTIRESITPTTQRRLLIAGLLAGDVLALAAAFALYAQPFRPLKSLFQQSLR